MLQTFLIFLNILLIEIILSVDNASVLAVIVNKNLSDQKERGKALRYGMIGAFVFRGLSLACVAYILYNPEIGAWFKILGGLFLVRLFYKHLTPEADSAEEGNVGWIEKITKVIKLNKFWTTVVMVEFIDIVFSLDNLVACVSLSSDIVIVCAAVFLGIVAMRVVSNYFSKLLVQYPSLENSAFIVILLLGVKMTLSGIYDFMPNSFIHELLNSHYMDLVFSLITLSIFLFPIFFKKQKS